MSTKFGQLESEPVTGDVVPVDKPLKILAPKIGPKIELHREESASPSTDQPQRQQGRLSPPQFAFINTTTNVQYSGQGSRSAARSHVMRNVHRKRGQSKLRLANSASPSNSRPLPANAHIHGLSKLSDVDGLGLHRLDLCGADKEARHNLLNSEKETDADYNSALCLSEPLPQESHDERRALPMSNLWALPVDVHATELIYHYIHIFAKTFVPMKQTWESAWFENASTDPACFHSTIFLSAAHKALLTGRETSLPVECFQHKGEAIRIIHERLSDPNARVTDGTIAAVACLAASEILSGTVNNATVHVGGLEKLVRMRGGLKQLGMDGFLEQFLYWVDLSNATAIKERPHFLPFEASPVYSKYYDSGDLWKYCESEWNEVNLVDLPMKSYQGLDNVGASLFHRLRQLTMLAASNSSLNNGSNQQVYAKLVLLLERQISVAVQERLAFRNGFGTVTFSQSSCLFYIPALIICYMILRPTPVRSSIYGPLVMRMKIHIDSLTPRQLFDRFPPEFWLWSLLFVGAASIGRPQQAYFQRITVQLCNLLDIHSWEKAKVTLREFAWADSICERPCKTYWDTLEGVEDSRIEAEVDAMDGIQIPVCSP